MSELGVFDRDRLYFYFSWNFEHFIGLFHDLATIL